MKKTACCIAIIASLLLMTLTMPGFAEASDNSNLEKAVDLKILGLFNGTPAGFELERVPTRIEGLSMLLRLLGKEQEASRLKLSHPFKDVPSWADSFVGYMYKNVLTTGTGATTFGSSEELLANQYVTFVLRALGYDDKKNDFNYENALDKAVQAGLLSASEAASLKNGGPILRNDLVGISYNALKTKLKASNNTLLDKLVSQDKAVSKLAASILGLYTSDLRSELGNITSYKPEITGNGYVAKNSSDFFNILKSSFYLNEQNIKIDVSGYAGDELKDFRAVYDRAIAAVSSFTGVRNFISSWKYAADDNKISLTISYRYSKSEFQKRMNAAAETLYKARHAVAGFIRQGMSDYDKELAIHNYIVNNTKYDYANYLTGNIPEASYTAYGCLVLGKAVCQGYSEATKLLSDLAALDCMVVEGYAKNGGQWEGHAWNIVKVDNKYYHVDTTFDDPVTDNGEDVLTYYYFNLPDKELSKGFRWDTSAYPACTSMESNYYYKNGLVVTGTGEFEKAVLAALNRKAPAIELKVKDYTEEKYSAPPEIMFKSGRVSGYSYSTNTLFGIISISDIKYR